MMSTQILTLQDIPRVVPGCIAKPDLKSMDAFEQERLLLATKAKALLGYGGLAADITGEVNGGSKEGKLTAALRSLGMEVLDLGRVLDYQMQEMVRLTREKIVEDLGQWAHGYFREAGWQRTDLGSYKLPIPEFVIDKALRLKEAMPSVHFSVQHLSEPKADPFLVAYADDEIYYIEAWDEPRFEGRVSR